MRTQNRRRWAFAPCQLPITHPATAVFNTDRVGHALFVKSRPCTVCVLASRSRWLVIGSMSSPQTAMTLPCVMQVARKEASGVTAAPGGEAGEASARTRIKAVVNIGRVELEMMRNIPEHRTIEPLARFQVCSWCVSVPDLWTPSNTCQPTEHSASAVRSMHMSCASAAARQWHHMTCGSLLNQRPWCAPAGVRSVGELPQHGGRRRERVVVAATRAGHRRPALGAGGALPRHLRRCCSTIGFS